MAKKKKKKGKQSTPVQGGAEPQGQGDFDLGDSGDAIQQTIAEDPLLRFFEKRWREIVVTLVIVFGVFYGRDVFEQTRLESLRGSADLLLDLQAQVEELRVLSESGEGPSSVNEVSPEESGDDEEGKPKEPTSSDEEVEPEEETVSDEELGAQTGEKTQVVSDKTDETDNTDETMERPEPTKWERGIERANELARALSQERSPYSELSVIYTRVIAAMEAQSGKGSVDGIAADRKSVGKEFEGVLEELQFFQQALILSQEDETLKDSMVLLQELVQKGSFTGSASLSLLLELSETELGKTTVSEDQLKTLSSSYIARNPEQAALLKKELPQLF